MHKKLACDTPRLFLMRLECLVKSSYIQAAPVNLELCCVRWVLSKFVKTCSCSYAGSGNCTDSVKELAVTIASGHLQIQCRWCTWAAN